MTEIELVCSTNCSVQGFFKELIFNKLFVENFLIAQNFVLFLLPLLFLIFSIKRKSKIFYDNSDEVSFIKRYQSRATYFSVNYEYEEKKIQELLDIQSIWTMTLKE